MYLCEIKTLLPTSFCLAIPITFILFLAKVKYKVQELGNVNNGMKHSNGTPIGEILLDSHWYNVKFLKWRKSPNLVKVKYKAQELGNINSGMKHSNGTPTGEILLDSHWYSVKFLKWRKFSDFPFGNIDNRMKHSNGTPIGEILSDSHWYNVKFLKWRKVSDIPLTQCLISPIVI